MPRRNHNVDRTRDDRATEPMTKRWTRRDSAKSRRKRWTA